MKTPADRLYMIAEGQQGYFTARQAVTAGYPTANHGRQCRGGAWTREHRGIYRLTRFPASPDGQYVLWSLWSRNLAGEPQGVYSHQTALSLYELADVMPSRLHMIVPPGFRRNTPIPKALILHHARVESTDIETRQGYRVVHPLRALTDLLKERSMDLAQLHKAFKQALDSGLIIRTEFKRHPDYGELKKLIESDAP